MGQELRIFRVDFISNAEKRGPLKMRRLWNDECQFGEGLRHTLLDANGRRASIAHYPGWRLCQFLALRDSRPEPDSAIAGFFSDVLADRPTVGITTATDPIHGLARS